MMMMKTYGVFGFMEYTAVVPLGSRTLTVPFTGGAANNRSVIPACYTTHNRIVQYAIEHSAEFRTGRIKLVKTVEVPSSAQTAQPAQPAKPATQPAKAAKPATQPAAQTAAPAADGLKEMQVACVDDARDYLTAQFAIPASQLRSRKQVDEAARTKGIKFLIQGD